MVRTPEETPPAGTHWSKRELAKAVGISPASVLRIWHAFGPQPWRTETFKISPAPFLIDKKALEDWIKVWNAQARPFRWTKTADQILDRICRYCDRISEPGH
ncbi:hypothetical protein R1T08_16325 [Streptomyces sp. SBC-4]|nr:hypothetical protein [Streptomyces sp. SBC-4]MDV5145731.1 hypothetical protein [Streptomyces sp. SBC-4]